MAIGIEVRKDGGEWVVETSYEGCVIETRERNYYDDSDFYAVVWDEATKSVLEVGYATTRAATYGNWATADLTDENRRKVERWCAARLYRMLLDSDRARARDVQKGRRVRVTKGRKVPIGTEGLVIFVGEPEKYGYYSPARRRVGIATSDRKVLTEKVGRNGGRYTVEQYADVVWTYADNCEVLEPERYYAPKRELLEAAKRGSYGGWRAGRMAGTGLAYVA